MHFVAPILAPLVYEADQSTQVRLRDYVVNHVFEDLDEEQPEDDDGKVVFLFINKCSPSWSPWQNFMYTPEFQILIFEDFCAKPGKRLLLK